MIPEQTSYSVLHCFIKLVFVSSSMISYIFVYKASFKFSGAKVCISVDKYFVVCFFFFSLCTKTYDFPIFNM